MRPRTLNFGDEGHTLVIEWTDGRVSRIGAGVLWAECPSAQARRRRLDGGPATPPAGMTITRLGQIGHYGVNIAFSDGHDRGIYPWVLLAGLAARPRPEDFIMPTPAAAP